FFQNYFYNFYGVAFFLNQGATIGPDSSVSSNSIAGITDLLSNYGNPWLGGATIEDSFTNDVGPSLDHGGISSYSIHRLNYQGVHEEASIRNERSGATVEAIFVLSPFPRVGAYNRPIFRCFVSGSATRDFPSFDEGCEGHHLHSILGYSYEPSYPGVLPFYRCRVGGDHFASWDSGCEGQISEGILGYATNGMASGSP